MAYVGGGGLAEIQAAREELEAILKTWQELDPILTNASQQLETWKQLEQVAMRYLIIVRRLNLPESVEGIITTLSKLMIIIRQAQMTLKLFEATTLTSPFGVALFSASLALTALSFSDVIGGY